MAMVACPSISDTILGLTLLDTSSVGQVCRRSWKRMGSNPAFSRSGAKDRFLSARSSDLLGDGKMIVMRTTERPTHPVGEFVRAEQAVKLHDPSLPMNPLRLNGVQPRALLREEATHDPHPLAAPFDPPVVPSEPSPDLFGDMPRGVVPDEEQNFLARRL